MRFPGRHLNLKLCTGHSMYTHTLFARFLYTPSCAYALPLRSPHTSLFFLIKDSSWRSLILYVQYIHFRFPDLHHRFRQARGNVDVNQLRLSARFKTGIISTRIWFGTPDGINIFVGRWKTSAHFATLRNPIFQRRNVDFAFKKRKDYPDFLAYN